MIPCTAKITNLGENNRGNRIKDHGKDIPIYHITVQPFTMLDSFPCGVQLFVTKEIGMGPF
jgi:hypothetical protein